jgi:KDO2-lipid IV(A) lauroyltransferase
LSYIIFILYCLGQNLALLLPTKVSYALAEFAGDISSFLKKEDIANIKANLRCIMPGADEKKIKRLAHEVFKNFAKYLIDFFRFSKITPSYVQEQVRIYNLEEIQRVYREKKGVIALTAHLGNFELAGAVLAELGINISAIALAHKNALINKFFVQQRALKNIEVVQVGTQIKRCYRALDEGRVIGFVGDRLFSQSGVKVTLLGKEVELPKGPAVLSIRKKVPIVIGILVRNPDNSFKYIFEKPIYPPSTGDFDKDVKTLMQEYVGRLEKYIRLYPEQWYIFHKFWETNPKEII